MTTEFLDEILGKGCKYLSLYNAHVRDDHLINQVEDYDLRSSKLRYLNLSLCNINDKILKKLLNTCQSLQKLSLEPRLMSTEVINTYLKCLVQNGSSLQTLHLNFDIHWNLQRTQYIVNNLVVLKEIRLSLSLPVASLYYLVNNLTPTVVKLDLTVWKTWSLESEFEEYFAR